MSESIGSLPFPRDPDFADLSGQLDENLNSSFQYYNLPAMGNTPSLTSQRPPQPRQEPSRQGDDWSRDQQGYFGNLGQTFDHSDAPAWLTPSTELSLHGAHASFAFSSGPDLIDQDRALQWSQGVAWDGSLMPLDPEDSHGYDPNTPTMQSAAIPDFQPYSDIATDFSAVMQAQHAQVYPVAPNACQQCQEQFENKTTLDDHAKQTQHGTHACICGETFSRFDCLNRHLHRFDPKILHPCLYCSRYSGPNAFHRRDHLIQHLRNFHHHGDPDETHDQQIPFPRKRPARKSITTCPHEGCKYHSQPSTTSPFYGDSQQLVFRTQKEFTKHLREEHDESPFPCLAFGCDRTGKKGYFRKKDLLRHQREHASASHFSSRV
ncbi:uncharacterized protein PAC_15772 [Phialocephala subalpina]|uniref:C2H2-type domain-containing protein n=1 Tax=Phialocephala subalpina TaxID=576137 RepID=A0A1L7XLF9_9HELO|nr:uncharacterized protein PAC_15772 [Phialocephala subalpina]